MGSAVNRFQSRNISTADVPAPRRAIWEVIQSPSLLARMTPLLDDIAVDDDRWRWQMSGICALGVEVSPSFTERMEFDPESEIRFTHQPPAGSNERAGANGVYRLDAVDDERTHLEIDITLCVELPLPRMSRRAVEGVMSRTMRRTGDVFARRLYDHLGVDPAAATQTTVRA
jgi:carbon monoxide dehydrogenase subunit G